jgi:hypothetical protein
MNTAKIEVHGFKTQTTSVEWGLLRLDLSVSQNKKPNQGDCYVKKN